MNLCRPWEYHRHDRRRTVVSRLSADAVVLVAEVASQADAEETEANARLIAAAPELLAAVEAALGALAGSYLRKDQREKLVERLRGVVARVREGRP